MIHLRKKNKEENPIQSESPEFQEKTKSTVKKRIGIVQSILNPIGFAKKLYDDDQVMTNAATITLFMVMSLFPMLMILLWLMSRMTLSPDVLLKMAASVLPIEMMELVESIVNDLYEKSLSISALSITIIMALWSSSTGISFLVTGLNRVYKREEQRNWFVHRALCLLYTGIFLLIILLVMVFLVYGSKFRVFLVSMWPVLENWTVLITILQNGIAIGGMILFFLAVYNIFPQKRLPYRKQMPGAITATIGWYSFSAIYAVYIRNSKNLAFMYGSLALIIVFLVWMYVCMNIVLIGGEINFLYNNRYYYKLYLLTEKQIDIQEYFMHANREAEVERELQSEPETVDEEENNREWEQEAKEIQVVQNESEQIPDSTPVSESETQTESTPASEAIPKEETESEPTKDSTLETNPTSASESAAEPEAGKIPFWKRKYVEHKKKKSEQ